MSSLDFSDSYFFASAFFSSARAAVAKRIGPTAGATPAARHPPAPHVADEAPMLTLAWPERVNTIGPF